MMNKVHVAIIDDGVNEEVFSTVKDLVHNIEIIDKSNIVQVADSNRYELSHGTICAAIVKKYAPDIIMSSIKVLHNMKGSKEKLITAIEWCLANNIDVISLSLGTEDYRDYSALKKISNYAYSKGLLIVAASSNNNVITYPASLSNVIGVKCDQGEILKTGQYAFRYQEMDRIDIVASSVQWLNDQYNTAISIPLTNSYATPLVTALVSNIVYNYEVKKIESIKLRLKENSNNDDNRIYNPYFNTAVDWVDKASLIEIGEFDQQNDYELDIVDIFTINENDEVLAAAKQYLNRNKEELRHIDTIIINVSNKYNKSIDAQQLIEYASNMGKNVVYLNDNYQKDLVNIDNVKISTKIFHPIIQEQWICQMDSNKNTNIEIPIIVVYNHSNQNICRNLQLLQCFFRNDGYHALTITQNCKGLLYNLKYISPNVLYVGDNVNNALLKYLEETFNADIIIVEADERFDIRWEKIEKDIIINVYSKTIHLDGTTFTRDKIQDLYNYIIEYFSPK